MNVFKILELIFYSHYIHSRFTACGLRQDAPPIRTDIDEEQAEHEIAVDKEIEELEIFFENIDAG